MYGAARVEVVPCAFDCSSVVLNPNKLAPQRASVSILRSYACACAKAPHRARRIGANNRACAALGSALLASLYPAFWAMPGVRPNFALKRLAKKGWIRSAYYYMRPGLPPGQASIPWIWMPMRCDVAVERSARARAPAPGCRHTHLT